MWIYGLLIGCGIAIWLLWDDIRPMIEIYRPSTRNRIIERERVFQEAFQKIVRDRDHQN